MTRILIFLISFWGGASRALAAGDWSGPNAILAAQALLVSQGTCEADWAKYLDGEDLTPIDLGERYQLWIVPCSLWADNPASTVYVTISEKSSPDGYLTKPMLFLSYFPTQKSLNADSVIYNVAYDAKTKSLLARYRLNGNMLCGSLARYQWSEGQQTFIPQEMWKNDNCKDPGVEWEKIVSAQP